MQTQPEHWRQLRVGQVGIEVTGDVEERFLDDVGGVETCSKPRVEAQFHHPPELVAIMVEDGRQRPAVTAAQPGNRVGRVAACLVFVGSHISYPRADQKAGPDNRILGSPEELSGSQRYLLAVCVDS